MKKILVYTDGRPAAARALQYAVALHRRLGVELAVLTVRPGTHATEEPPPVGIDTPVEERRSLPKGIRTLIKALDLFTESGLVAPQSHINIRDISNGYFFVCNTTDGQRIPFYERYGNFIEALNHEVYEQDYQLVVIAPPRRGSIGRFLLGDTTRLLALDLHTSLLVIRGGNPDSRFLVCADGSPSARRVFPLLQEMLPAITGRIDLLWVRAGNTDREQVETAQSCLTHAGQWLSGCGKTVRNHQVSADRLLTPILETAGADAVIVMGASLRHDVYRRMMGSLPLQVLSKTDASVLLVKLPPEAETEMMTEPFAC